MVGVAGKSKACNDCKRRRVKCGFERPGCARCAKAKIQCSGYDQEVIYVNRTLANPSTSAPTVLARARTKRAKSCPIQDELDDLIELLSTSRKTASPFRRKAFHLLQKLYLPQPAVADNDPNSGGSVTWVNAVCELEGPCSALDHALVAFCTAQVYITETGNVSHQLSVERYHHALGLLSSVLSWEGEDRLDYILASIVVLSTCELFICSTDDGWRVHIQGIADVLRLKNRVSKMPTEVWISLCSRLRVMTVSNDKVATLFANILAKVLSQLTRKQQVSVTAAQWTELLPGYLNTNPIDKLMSLVCELPGVLANANKLFYTAYAGRAEETAAVTALWAGLADIRKWEAELHATSSTFLYVATPSKLVNPSDSSHKTKLFPYSLEFRSLQVASYFVSSWSMQLHILITLLRLSQEVGVAETVPIQFGDLLQDFDGVQNEGEKLYRSLCQSIEFSHRIEMGTFGPQIMLYAKFVMHCFIARYGSERDLEWFLNISNMSGPPTRCAIKLMTFQGERV